MAFWVSVATMRRRTSSVTHSSITQRKRATRREYGFPSGEPPSRVAPRASGAGLVSDRDMTDLTWGISWAPSLSQGADESPTAVSTILGVRGCQPRGTRASREPTRQESPRAPPDQLDEAGVDEGSLVKAHIHHRLINYGV